MKAIFSYSFTVILFIISTFSTYGQQIPVDLRLTGNPSLSTYPGFPIGGTFNLTFTNSSSIDMPVGNFTIQCSMPPGFIFNATYPTIPAGWSYSKLDDLTAILTPTMVISGTFPAGNFTFNVPYTTAAPVTNGSYVATTISSIQYPDPNSSNNRPSGSVSISNTVLPVDFVSISSTVKNCSAEIDWNVANQIGIKQYELQSSTDGINFTTGKTVSPNNQNAYSADLPVNGSSTYYYRIKAVDLDGSFKFSAITSVKANCDGKQGAFTMYPNPVLKGELVNLSSTINESTMYRILDMAGKTMREGRFTGNTTFQINTGGTYIIDLQSASTSAKYKLVVQ